MGTWGDNPKSIDHELAHAFFFAYPEYRREALEIVGDIDPEVIARVHAQFARSGGYHPSVYDDEVHAGALASLERWGKRGDDVDGLLWARAELELLFDRYLMVNSL
tara:strand:+ start:827 stop:1144 length:318 start_codon:yes stop_codon:yes gene_type:complete